MKDEVRQVNKARCDECPWSYISANGESEAIARAHGIAHGHITKHHVHLYQDIIDLYLAPLWPRQ